MTVPRANFPFYSTARPIRAVLASAALLFSVLTPATAADAEPRSAPLAGVAAKDVDHEMLGTLKAMQQELQQIKALLAARPLGAPTAAAMPPAAIPQVVTLDLTDRPFRGNKDAPVSMIEITDYQCPYCGRHAQQTMPQIEKDYIATGKVKYYVIDLPLEAIHPNAFKAAVATRCAGEQNKFWEMHEQLFANQQKLSDWSANAAALHLDVEKFNSCLSSNRHDEDIRKDIALAQRVGVQSTPSFYFAGGSGPKVKTFSYVNGARPFDAMKGQIDALLQQPQK